MEKNQVRKSKQGVKPYNTRLQSQGHVQQQKKAYRCSKINAYLLLA